MKINYKPRGICANKIEIDVENGIINSVSYTGGCPGNLAGISKLVRGMKVSDVIEKFDGIRCGSKSTSCPDQLAQALKGTSGNSE